VLFLAGGLLAAAGMAWLGRLSPTTDLVWVVAPAALAMTAGGLMFAPVTIAADGYSAAFSAGAAIYLATAVAGALALPARLGDASPRMASA
jgi:hypothetical protein